MTRVAAREYAVITVYGLDCNPDAELLLEERLGSEFFERYASLKERAGPPPDAEQSAYIRRVTLGVAAHLAELDSYIEKYAINWGFARLPRMTVAILRVCMFEVLYMRDEVPAAAAINAAIDISKQYESAEVTGFTNGILGAFSRKETGV
ncbi:MAG: transcription antitermination protein NusB [Oscillospiraceae bacterium]|jgi:N utilization substance protein B|nr:transcription antitermination protein NusB [Oscillospiraceae bacterium]